MKETKDFIFGIHTILEAIDAGKEINKILIKKGLQGSLSAELRAKITERNITSQYVPEIKLNSITRKNHQGCIAFISPVEYQDLESLIPMIYEKGETPFLIMLDGLTDVRNFGAIARTAECAGAHGIIIPKRGGVHVTSDAVKTSAGALHKIPVCRVENLANTIEWLQQSGLQVIAASEKAQHNYHEIEMTSPTLIVMGAEDTGVSDPVIRKADQLVKISMVGTIASLNVSVAAGILMFELLKQRQM